MIVVCPSCATRYDLPWTPGPQGSVVRCQSCDGPFDIDFTLDDLMDSLCGQESPAVREADGSYQLPDGRRFRLPTGADELAILSVQDEQREQELLRRCMIAGPAQYDPESLQAAMKAAGPLVDLEVSAQCPECGAGQAVYFDLQHYLLAQIKGERVQRAREVHCLAKAYGWSLREILDRDTFLLVVARGDKSLESYLPATPIKPIAFANPIWLLRRH